MRTRLQLVVAFVLLGALVAAGALLPARIAEHLDGLLLDKIETQALTPDEEMLPSPATTPLTARLKLLTLPSSEVLTTRLETGKQLSQEAIGKVLDHELDDLRSRGLFPVNDLLIDKPITSSFEARPVFHVAPSQPDLNGIIWEVLFSEPELSGAIYLDDESSKIVSYRLKYDGTSEELFTEESGEQWLAYLGLAADGLQVVREDRVPSHGSTGEGSVAGPPASVNAPDAHGGPDIGGFPERFHFTLPAKPSPLQFYCEQQQDEGMRAIVEIILLRDTTWPSPSYGGSEPVAVTQ